MNPKPLRSVTRTGSAAARRGRPAPLAQSVVREGRMIYSTLRPLGRRETIPQLLERNAAAFGARPAYREKRGGGFAGVTWEQFLLDVVNLGRYLRAAGVGKGDRAVVLSRNRGEMLAAEFALMSIGAIHVPLFPGYSRAQTSALVAHSGARTVFVSDGSQLDKLAANERIERIISFDAIDPQERRRSVPWFRGEFLGLAEAVAGGRLDDPRAGEVRAFFRAARACDPRDPCLMMYTSGTAGELKGVVLTHDNILSQQRALRRIWRLAPEDRFLSYLPWHHSFGGIFEKYNALYNAAPIALDDSFGKDFPRLLANWKEIRPTVYFSVPAVYLELYNHVRAHPEEEREIFHPELKFFFTAAAPLPGHISEFLAAKRIPVIEGWGLTETSPCCTVTDLHEPRSLPGMVGYPIPAVKVRLAEDGEILIRGPNVMLGYHENEAATRRVLPGDGWFRTGDLGELVGKGLRLVARKDRLFKLLNGERVTPTPLEVRLASLSRYIRHVVVAGAGRDHVAALIFPNTALIREEFGGDRLRADREVRASLREAVERLNAAHPVRYERIRAFAVVGRALTVEDGELTPSMKVRVTNILKRCEGYVEAIYEPTRDCDCRFLKKVVRLMPDPRPCFRGKDVTLDRCHECGLLVFDEP